MRTGGDAVRRLWLIVPVLVLIGCGTAIGSIGSHSAKALRGSAERPAATAAVKMPPIRHVYTIIEENESASVTFGPNSPAPYLAKTLTSEGAFLPNYYGTGHNSNDNYISMISGQPPNLENEADCQTFSEFATPGTSSFGAETGEGCVYPATVNTIAGQLDSAGLTWRDFNQSMGNDPTRETAECGHPEVGTQDHTQTETATDAYATRHDPFVYFHSVIDDQAYCDDHVVALGSSSGTMPAAALKGETGLATDLRAVRTTPNFSFITPNLCEDGHDYPCKNEPSGASALADIDRFLEAWVPKITSSPAFRKNGLLEITFDESDGAQSDSSSCCEEKPGPASSLPGITGPGGGRIGAVLISPFIKPGTVSTTPYNHYSSLASFESLLGLGRLAYAADVPATFGQDVFTAAR